LGWLVGLRMREIFVRPLLTREMCTRVKQDRL